MRRAGMGFLVMVTMAVIGCTTTPSSGNRQNWSSHETTVVVQAQVEIPDAYREAVPHNKLSTVASPETTSMPAANADPYAELSGYLAKAVKDDIAQVTVGNFVFEGSDQMSAFSSMLRKELEIALPETGKFKIATRERLAELLEEDGLYDAGILDPGSSVDRMKLEGVGAIVRGSFHYEYPRVTVYAQLAWLNGAEANGAKVVIDARDIHTRILPDPKEQADDIVRPQNMAIGSNNVQDVKDRIKKIPHDFDLFLSVSENKRDFAEGENVSYTVWSEEACHIAVFCHQVDGSTAVLFPNPWCADSRIPAERKTHIPGTDKKGFEIVVGTPFGADVVQVIACTKRSTLHKMVEGFAKKAPQGITYRSIARGQFSQGIAGSFSGTPDPGPDAPGPTKWSEAHVVVSTYPRFGQ